LTSQHFAIRVHIGAYINCAYFSGTEQKSCDTFFIRNVSLSHAQALMQLKTTAHCPAFHDNQQQWLPCILSCFSVAMCTCDGHHSSTFSSWWSLFFV